MTGEKYMVLLEGLADVIAKKNEVIMLQEFQIENLQKKLGDIEHFLHKEEAKLK